MSLSLSRPLPILAVLLCAGSAFAADPQPTIGGAQLYGDVRGSLAVPMNYTGTAQSYSAEVGALFRDGNQLGMRFVYVPDPPDVYGDETPKMAFGPVLSWAYSVRVARSFDLYPAIGLGAVFGQSPTTDMNKVLPYVQGGLGLRLRIPTANEGAVTLGPEIGFVPTIMAPYMAFNVGMIGQRPKSM